MHGRREESHYHHSAKYLLYNQRIERQPFLVSTQREPNKDPSRDTRYDAQDNIIQVRFHPLVCEGFLRDFLEVQEALKRWRRTFARRKVIFHGEVQLLFNYSHK